MSGDMHVAGRGPIIALVISLSAMAHGVGPTAAAAEVSVEFQDAAGNTVQSFSPGDSAAFYISGADLGTVETSTAIWTEISAPVPRFTVWDLATGQPEAATFALSVGSSYGTITPASTPLYSAPTVYVDGGPDPFPLNGCNALTGEFSLAFNVSASSSLQVEFPFYVLDSYPAAQHRARVTSTSDGVGEWVAIGAVVSVSGTGVCPFPGLYPPPGLFSGQVLLSDDAATAGSGDGAVWVSPGDVLAVTHYGSDGSTPVGAHQVDVVEADPGLTPLPATGRLFLGLLSVVFAVAVAWRRRRSPGALRPHL